MTDDTGRPSMTDLIALAERVEKAIGPDRELDLAIMRATRTCTVPSDLLNRLERPFGNGGKGFAFHDSPVHETGYCLGALPFFTSSLDAAMTLVPEGMILRQYMVTRYVPHSCEVAYDFAHGGWIGNSDHSLALALTAASLRARSALLQEEVGRG